MSSLMKIARAAATLAILIAVAGCDNATPPAAVAPAEEVKASPPPTPPAPTTIIGNFTSVDGWQAAGGAPAPEGLVEGAYTFGPLGGTMSREFLPANPGEKFAVDYSVKLVKAPKNGKPANFVVGPMFLDAQGGVLGWGNVEPPLAEATRDAHVEMEAPAGTTTVRLYIGGMWASAPPIPNGEVAFTAAKLAVVK